jgi:hypothetical protein
MGIFNKKEKVLDFSKGYHEREERKADLKSGVAVTRTPATDYGTNSSNDSGSSGFMSFFGASSSSTSADSNSRNSEDSDGLSAEERKRRLSKRLLDMTNKIEDLSNQMYHLQQRIEVLERKNSSSAY